MNKDNKKKTIGEELWLVHLKRYRINPEDYDTIPPKRKRSKSIGQELYDVHLKRCQGLCFEADVCCDCDKSSSHVNNNGTHDRARVRVVDDHPPPHDHHDNNSSAITSSDESVKSHPIGSDDHHDRVSVSP